MHARLRTHGCAHTLYPMLQVIQDRMAHQERLIVERTLLLESLKESMGQEVCAFHSLAWPSTHNSHTNAHV